MSVRGKLPNSSPIKKGKIQKVNIVSFDSSQGCHAFYTTNARIACVKLFNYKYYPNKVGL